MRRSSSSIPSWSPSGSCGLPASSGASASLRAATAVLPRRSRPTSRPRSSPKSSGRNSPAWSRARTSPARRFGRRVAPMRYMRFLLILMALLSSAGQVAHGQGYPVRPVRLIVGFAAGGPTDIPARYIADKLGDLIGQRVVVENKPAAAGMLATREALAQPRDGYTLLLCTHFESINVAVYKNPQYKLDDLAPISLIAKYYYGIGLANVVPATDIAGFVRHAKAHPGEISYGTLGPGSAQEIFARQLERA